MNSRLARNLLSSDHSSAVKKKSLDHELLNNYRPVSNLSYLSKIIEKAVANRLVSYLQNNCLLEEFQSAYKRNHSCETAMLRIQSDILNAMDQKRVVYLILLDLSAAFDTIDLDILLDRLQYNFGITDIAIKWFHSYLTGRSFRTLIDNAHSPTQRLDFGVPQGSVLGPILLLCIRPPSRQ